VNAMVVADLTVAGLVYEVLERTGSMRVLAHSLGVKSSLIERMSKNGYRQVLQFQVNDGNYTQESS